jgi:hypothetical protein
MSVRDVQQAQPDPGLTVPEPNRGGVDRFTLGVALGVVILVAIGIAVAAIGVRGQGPPDMSTPEGVALAYELDIQRGEADRAWDLLASDAQHGTTRQEFLARAATVNRGGEVRFSVDNARVDGDTAHLDLVRVTPTPGFLGLGGGSYTSSSPVTLVRENGAWRISVPSQPYVVMQPAGTRP